MKKTLVILLAAMPMLTLMMISCIWRDAMGFCCMMLSIPFVVLPLIVSDSL